MNSEDKLFIKQYREDNVRLIYKERPPCVKCPDEQILACSNMANSPGCADFMAFVTFSNEFLLDGGFAVTYNGEKLQERVDDRT